MWMFFCDGARERRDGAQVNLKAHALQLITTLAALIVEPPHPKRRYPRVHMVCWGRHAGGGGEGLAVCRAWLTLHGAAAQTCRQRGAIESPRHARFNNAETNGRVKRCSGL
jgi:hypothetical protein